MSSPPLACEVTHTARLGAWDLLGCAWWQEGRAGAVRERSLQKLDLGRESQDGLGREAYLGKGSGKGKAGLLSALCDRYRLSVYFMLSVRPQRGRLTWKEKNPLLSPRFHHHEQFGRQEETQ